MFKLITIPAFLSFLITPLVVFAAPQNFADLVDLFVSLINTAVVVLISLAILGFFWGLAQYVFSAKDSAKIEEGRKIMVWGAIALFVMVSLWGILRILRYTFLGF